MQADVEADDDEPQLIQIDEGIRASVKHCNYDSTVSNYTSRTATWTLQNESPYFANPVLGLVEDRRPAHGAQLLALRTCIGEQHGQRGARPQGAGEALAARCDRRLLGGGEVEHLRPALVGRGEVQRRQEGVRSALLPDFSVSAAGVLVLVPSE